MRLAESTNQWWDIGQPSSAAVVVATASGVLRLGDYTCHSDGTTLVKIENVYC